MNSFDSPEEHYQHDFVRHDPGMLQNMFGSTEVTPFWLADMDFKVAQPITEELRRLVERGVYAYELATKQVFGAIAEWNQQRHNLYLDQKFFIQAPGVLTGIALLIRELSKPGDGIIIQPPVYHQFARLIKTADRKIITNPLKVVNDKYEMDFDNLEKKIQSEHVRVLLLCNPHNPVGRVWSRQELQSLIRIADQHDVTIISDEIHSDIIFKGHEFNSITSLGSTKHITLLGSPAKTFGMQSIANGYLYITDETLRKSIYRTTESMYLSHGNAFSTYGAIAAFRHGGPWLDEMLTYLQETITWIRHYLEKEIPGVRMFEPEGTYQVWLDFSRLNKTPEDLNHLLVQKAKLALTPGVWFDQESDTFMRMNIASPLSKIQTAFRQLKKAIDEDI